VVKFKHRGPNTGQPRRICYLQANEIVKTTARDYQERQMAHRFKTVAGIWDKWLCTQTNSPHNVRMWISKGEQLSSTLLPF
jgi:hypothetical protein